jgi:hypothetical protein
MRQRAFEGCPNFGAGNVKNLNSILRVNRSCTTAASIAGAHRLAVPRAFKALRTAAASLHGPRHLFSPMLRLRRKSCTASAVVSTRCACIVSMACVSSATSSWLVVPDDAFVSTACANERDIGDTDSALLAGKSHPCTVRLELPQTSRLRRPWPRNCLLLSTRVVQLLQRQAARHKAMRLKQAQTLNAALLQLERHLW